MSASEKQPCPCGNKNAEWRGDILRVYCCAKCWIKIERAVS